MNGLIEVLIQSQVSGVVMNTERESVTGSALDVS